MDVLPANETWEEIADHHLDHVPTPAMLAHRREHAREVQGHIRDPANQRVAGLIMAARWPS
jgi:hypothetical protein